MCHAKFLYLWLAYIRITLNWTLPLLSSLYIEVHAGYFMPVQVLYMNIMIVTPLAYVVICVEC